jgi:hypothetical protein
MDKSQLTLSQGIIGDTPIKPTKDLMRNGVWLVPPEERPKGWERIGAAPAPPPLAVPAVLKSEEETFPKFPQKNQGNYIHEYSERY